MADSELRALADLAAEYADRALTGTIQGVQTALLNHPRAYQHLRDWLSGGRSTELAAVSLDA